MSVGLEPIFSCGCDGCFIVFVNNAQPPYAVQWSDGQTGTMNTNQTEFCGFCPGSYSVTVTDINGQTAEAVGTIIDIPFNTIEIVPLNPSACNFDSSGVGNQNCNLVCAGSTTTYTTSTNSQPPAGNQLSWQVSGASSWSVDPSGNFLTVTWNNPGIGSITVFGFNNQGCSMVDDICVTILNPPKAQIGSVPAAAPGANLQVCKGQVVNFQDLSTGDADYVEWFFSDDFTQSTTKNPQHTYQIPGTHTVTLIAKNKCLCPDTTMITVEVMDAEAPTLDCVATICPGETVTYTSSNGCAPFTWTVSGNGTILDGGTATSDSITVEWNDGPNGIISLMATSCSGITCPVAGIINIPIISDNAEILGEEQVCPGSTEVYSIEAFGGTGFTWKLSGGGNIKEGQGTNRVTVQWSGTGNNATPHWLSVSYDNCYLGCSGTDSIPVFIRPFFVVNGPVESCLNSNDNFNAKLTSNNTPILCNWTLTGPSGNVVWTSSSPSATASVPFIDGDGYYDLTAVPDNPTQSCTEKADWAIHVNPLPAKLDGIKGTEKICPGTTYTYKAEGGTSTTNYFWTIQNGPGAVTNKYGRTININWNASGPRWVAVAQLSQDGLGCKSDTVHFDVTPIGIPDITGVPVACENSTRFYSIEPLENIDIQWQITPSDAGTVANGQGTEAAEIYWSNPGAHTVSVQVCALSAQFPVTINPLPDPMVQAPAGLCPGALGLVQSAGAYINYSWKDEAGAEIGTGANIQLGFGTYALEVTDVNGCVGISEFYIDSYDKPDVSLTTNSPTGFCNNSLFVPLTGLINQDADYTFQWYHDGALIPGQTGVTYSTNQYGQYTIQATNAHGCTTVAGPILLFPYCQVDGNCTGQNCGGGLCPPGTIDIAVDPTARCDSFEMHLLDPNAMLVGGSELWIVGISGGAQLGTSTLKAPTFVMDNAGEYVVILNVELKDGTTCHLYEFFSAEAVARIDVLPDCPGEVTQFLDVSEFLPSGGITDWDWDFGDPASGANNQSSIRNSTHVYDPSDSYSVNLTVVGTSGCISTASTVVDVPELPDITFPDPAFKCAGNALAFTPPPNAASITDISWDFGDPASGALNDADGTPAYHNFNPAGNYTVSATAKNIHGCTNSFSRIINIPANTLSGTITPPAPGPICEGKTLNLLAPAGAVSYLWSDESGSTTPNITVSEEGTFKVTITDANGCTYVTPPVDVAVNPAPDALIKALEFNDLDQIVGTSYPSTAVCEGEDVVLQTVANVSVSYQWSVTNGNTPFLNYTDDRNNLLSSGHYQYVVTVTNPSTGCTAVTTPFIVDVNPVPSGFSISGQSFCAGTANTLTYNGPQPPNWNLIWSTGATGPTLSTDEPGAYQIRVINEFGCEERSNTWTVLPGPPVNSVPAGCHTRCNPDTLCMPNLPNVISWQWYQDGNPIPGATSPNFIATQSGTYWAEMTDIFGCNGQSGPLDLNLYDGYGNILGQVWSDVNDNGIIDAADTLLSGIPVILYQNGSLFGNSSSGVNGGFAFTNVLSTDYSVEIDQNSLPFIWTVVIGQDDVNLSGCDVEGKANLLLHYGCSVGGTLELTGCPGTMVTYQGVDIAVGGTQEFLYTSSQGCDSTLVVTVNALSTSTGSQTLYGCPGTSITYEGINISVGSTQAVTLQNWLGCDSVVTVSVLALATSTGKDTLYACQGSFATYQGIDIPVGSSQDFTLTNAAGCDSIVTVNVQPLPSSNSATLLFACKNGFLTYNGTDIPAGTVQSFTFQNSQGCDSIVTVTVAEVPPATGAETLFACPGSTANYQGTDVPVGTSQDFTLQNWLGCDSVVTITVQAWPVSSSSFSAGVCPGETYTYQGLALSAGTTQAFVLQNWLGCDSTVTVTVNQLQPTSNQLQVNVCPGKTYDYNGTAVPGGSSMDFHYTNAVGCDSTLTLQVQEFPASDFSLLATESCSNTPSGTIEAQPDAGGQAPYRYSLNPTDFQDDNTFHNLAPGTYHVYLEDVNTCVFEQEIDIPMIPALNVQLSDAVLACDSISVMLEPVITGGDDASLAITWSDGSTGMNTMVTEPGMVWVEASDQCATVRSSAEVMLADLAEDLNIVYVPNIMMPASENPDNAQFRPFFGDGILPFNYTFRVFDRWGNQLFYSEDPAAFWDGTIGGEAMNPGVEVWYLETDVEICGRVMHVVKKGDVTVLR